MPHFQSGENTASAAEPDFWLGRSVKVEWEAGVPVVAGPSDRGIRGCVTGTPETAKKPQNALNTLRSYAQHAQLRAEK
jgi:hypothetical protein